MKKILFPTDFSPAADNAFIYALKLANKVGASITTLHCYELPALKSSHLPRTTREIYETMSLEEFENYKDHVPHLRSIAEEAGLASIPLDHVMKEGEAIHNIVTTAKKDKYDLIVMGTTGASGIKRIFLGSVAAETMENAPCPVLAVPTEAAFDGVIDHVGFTTDYQEEEKRALDWLANWPALQSATIHCVHIDLKHTDDLTQRMDVFSRNFMGLKNVSFSVVDHTHFEKAIVQFIEERELDVLAMVIHKRNFLKELFAYSFTKSLAYHLTTPILAIPENAIQNLNPAMEDRQFGLTGQSV
ncbi:MAG: universal stress protein [Bacteroidota bacterium]